MPLVWKKTWNHIGSGLKIDQLSRDFLPGPFSPVGSRCGSSFRRLSPAFGGSVWQLIFVCSSYKFSQSFEKKNHLKNNSGRHRTNNDLVQRTDDFVLVWSKRKGQDKVQEPGEERCCLVPHRPKTSWTRGSPDQTYDRFRSTKGACLAKGCFSTSPWPTDSETLLSLMPSYFLIPTWGE